MSATKELKRTIQNYGLDVEDFETSPFESIDMLHVRSSLQERYAELDAEDRENLRRHDEVLLVNAARMYEHIRRVFAFNSDRPTAEWWWHLDKVAAGQLTVK